MIGYVTLGTNDREKSAKFYVPVHPERITRAVALSAATVRAPAAGEFDRATYEELLPKVAVSPV